MEAPEKIYIEDEHGEGSEEQWEYGCWDVRKQRGYDTAYIRADLVPAWQPIETAPELMRDAQWAIVETTEGVEVGWWSAGQNCFLSKPGWHLWGDAIKYFAVPPCD